MKRAMSFAVIALLSMLPWAQAQEATDDAATADKEWRAQMDQLAPIAGRMATLMRDPGDAQLRQELYRFLYSQVGAAYFGLVYSSPEYPDFWPMFNEAFNQGFPNPDDAYYLAVIDGDGVYKLTGYRGTVRVLDLNVGSGPLNANGTGSFGPTLADYDFDALHLRKDGWFEVILSAERPRGWKGDWWRLDAKATNLLVRERAYDLLREVDARIAIERLDRPAIRPRLSAQELEARLRAIPAWVEGWTKFSIEWVKRLRAQGLVNKLQVKDYSSTGGVSNQRYIEGMFDLEPDEALLVETELPKHCRYWNFQLADELWSSVGWLNRQSTLNGHTARLDKDGKFRAVVSARDPGVPNWIDNAGLKQGLVYGRWMGCDSHPVPVATKIKLADVRRYLPTDTPTVTPEARDAAIRLHRRGVQLRRRW